MRIRRRSIISKDMVARMQAMGATPRHVNELWEAYLQRVEQTYQYLLTGEIK